MPPARHQQTARTYAIFMATARLIKRGGAMYASYPALERAAASQHSGQEIDQGRHQASLALRIAFFRQLGQLLVESLGTLLPVYKRVSRRCCWPDSL